MSRLNREGVAELLAKEKQRRKEEGLAKRRKTLEEKKAREIANAEEAETFPKTLDAWNKLIDEAYEEFKLRKHPCPECGAPMIFKKSKSRFGYTPYWPGEFLACSAWPDKCEGHTALIRLAEVIGGNAANCYFQYEKEILWAIKQAKKLEKEEKLEEEDAIQRIAEEAVAAGWRQTVPELAAQYKEEELRRGADNKKSSPKNSPKCDPDAIFKSVVEASIAFETLRLREAYRQWVDKQFDCRVIEIGNC